MRDRTSGSGSPAGGPGSFFLWLRLAGGDDGRRADDEAAALALLDDHGLSLAPGSEANVALCDLEAEWTVGEEGFESRSHNSWCDGRTLTGRVLMTVAGGQVAYRLRSFSLGVAQ